MPDFSEQNNSFGQALLHEYELKQGTAFPAKVLDSRTLSSWKDYRSEPKLRERAIKESSFLVVLSQNCDIACNDDKHDPCVELAVFIPIRSKESYDGNKFAHSTRQLQLIIQGIECESKVRHTVRVPKESIYEILANHQTEIFSLSSEQRRTLVLWRANRYQRAALPDRFNHAFLPLFNEALPDFEEVGRDVDDSSRSYIRAIYVYINNWEEEGECYFSFLALLRGDTPDYRQSKIDDVVDQLCNQLESVTNFSLSDDPKLAALAERETTVTVAVLGEYVKLNLDYLSLRHGDLDTGY